MTGAWAAGVRVEVEGEVELGMGAAVVVAVWKEVLDQICTETELDQIRNLQTGMACLLYTSPSPRDVEESRMPSSA